MLHPLALLISLLYGTHLLLLCLQRPGLLLRQTVAGLAVGTHLAFAGFSLFQAQALHLGLLPSLSALYALTLTARYLLLRLALPRLLDGALALMALGVVLLQGFLPNSPALNHAQTWAFSLHIIIAISAYVALALAAVLAGALWMADRRLHQKPSSRLAQSLPPLLTLEIRLFQLLWTGFSLLSITLITGVFFSEQVFGKPALLSHKVVFSVLAWLVFAVLLTGRLRHGWRGRLAVRWTLTGFGFLVLAYVGSKFVLEVVLHRTLG